MVLARFFYILNGHTPINNLTLLMFIHNYVLYVFETHVKQLKWKNIPDGIPMLNELSN